MTVGGKIGGRPGLRVRPRASLGSGESYTLTTTLPKLAQVLGHPYALPEG